jgi:hypothetical protein
MALANINQLRNIEWQKSFLWEFIFPDVGGVFTEFFPAIDIEENIANLESFSFEAYNNTFKIPKSRTVKDIKITFVDDVDQTGLKFFTNWISNEIFDESGNNSTTAPLQDIAKQVIVQKLSPSRDVLTQSSYLVYPEGPLVFRGNSDSGLVTHTATLVIVGTIAVGERGDRS